MIPITPAFESAIKAIHRRPVQVAAFYFPNKTVYISDKEITINGVHYEPLVESWGTLADNSRIEAVISGDAIEARTMSITVFNLRKSSLVQAIRATDIINVEVDVFQWFSDLPESEMVLLDKFICRPPVTMSEASILLNIDLVSVIMKENRYLSGAEKEDHNRFPYVIGEAKQIPLVDLQTAPTTTTAMYIDDVFTGTLEVRNTIGFEASGKITVDSEILTYSSKSNTSFVIDGRGIDGTTALPHESNTIIADPTKNYDYAVCLGPVTTLENLTHSGGAAYDQSATFLPGENPAKVRFIGRPPYTTEATSQPPITLPPEYFQTDYFGTYYEAANGEGAGAVSSPENINNDSGTVIMNIDQTLNGGDASLIDQMPENNIGAGNGFCTVVAAREQIAMSFQTEALCGVSSTGQSTFGKDLSANGTFKSATLKIYNTGAFSTCIDSDFIINLIKPDGSKEVVASWNHNNLACSSPLASPPWRNYVQTFSLEGVVTSWGDLAASGGSLEWACNTESSQSNKAGNSDFAFRWSINYYAPPTNATPAYQEDVSMFNIDLSGLGTFISAKAIVTFSSSITNASVRFDIVERIASANPADNTVLSSNTTSATMPKTSVEVGLSASTWNDLRNTRCGLHQTIIGPDTGGITRSSHCTLWNVIWEISYSAPGDSPPGEVKVFYVTDLRCDAVTGGAEITPAHVVEHLLNTYGYAAHLDQQSIDDAKAVYIADSYYISGAFDKSFRLHDALRNVLRHGIARLKYSRGLIGMTTYQINHNNPVSFYLSDVRLKSFKEERAMIDSIINDLIVYYDVNSYDGVHNDKVEVSDADSINQYGLKERKLDYSFVRTQALAEFIANKILSEYKKSGVLLTFSAYFSAYPLQKQDVVYFETGFAGWLRGKGRVMTVSREFGSGKLNKINRFDITLINPETFLLNAFFAEKFVMEEKAEIGVDPSAVSTEIIEMEESIIADAFEPQKIEKSEEIEMTESVFVSASAGYGNGGYGETPYGY